MLFKSRQQADRFVSLLCFVGLLWCLYLFQIGQGLSDRFCQVLGSSCLGAMTSQYGSVLGISLASLGGGYFALQGVLASIVAGSGQGMGAIRILRNGLATIALVASLYYSYLLAFRLPQGCAACFGVHLTNLCILLACALPAPGLRRVQRSAFVTQLSQRPIFTMFIALLLAIAFVFGMTLLETKAQLRSIENELAQNLDYYRLLHEQAPVIAFDIDTSDTVIGEPAIAMHQVVLFQKENCEHCRAARERLKALVHRHDTGIYLLLKTVDPAQLQSLSTFGFEKVPAVFIDGRRALGWQMPGFMDIFTEDCGC